MDKRVLSLRDCFLLSLSLFLVGCTVDRALVDAQTFNISTPYTKKVAYYQQKAKQSEGIVEAAYRLKQAGRLIYQGMYPRASQLLASLEGLPPQLNSEKRLLKAELDLKLSRQHQAMRELSKIPYDQLADSTLKAHFHQLASTIYFNKGLVALALKQRLALNALLKNKDQQLANLRNTWAKLNEQTLSQIDKALGDKELPQEVAAWLTLNRLLRTEANDRTFLSAKLKDWRATYPYSLVQQLISSESMRQMTHYYQPKQIALLLPLSGEYSGPGKAVRDGFMTAFYRSKQRHASVRFYDMNNREAVSVYHQAVKNGADFVVGPLLKPHTKAVSGLSLSVPTLLLNDSLGMSKENLYQFAISPQEEIAEVAFKAYQDGHRRALLIAPSGRWGGSMMNAFNDAWRYMGGEVIDKMVFDKKTNMEAAVKTLLQIDKSQARYQQAKNVINERPSFVLERRRDFDVIFLLAYPSKARQIRPLLRYYYAGDVPIYSSSMIYSGYPNAHADRDLNGIIFADMPWLVDNSRLVRKRWPEQLNSYNRLFAVGQDAFLLTQQFDKLHSFPLLGLSDTSGTLYLDKSGKIHRKLLWLSFKNGVPKVNG